MSGKLFSDHPFDAMTQPSSKLLGAAFSALGLLAASLQAADFVTLENGSLVQGKIIALSKEVIEIDSPHALSPLKVRGEAVNSLTFEQAPAESLPSHDGIVSLINGDRFPADIVSLDNKSLKVKTWFAGELAIDRTQVAKVQLGTRPQKQLYQGPKGLDHWVHQNAWNSNQNSNSSFFSVSDGSIGRNFPLPPNFIFRTKLKWQGAPSLQVFLASDAVSEPPPTDGYQIDLNSRMIKVTRVQQQDGETVFHLLGSHRLPENLRTIQRGTLELRVDRGRRQLFLYWNNLQLGHYLDPFAAPEGNGIVFNSLLTGRNAHRIEDIGLWTWDGQTQQQQSEPRLAKAAETVALREGDRYGGMISAIEPSSGDSDELVARLAWSEKQQTFTFPLSEVATLYLSKKRRESDADQGAFALSLGEKGSLSLQAITLGDKLAATHPLIGPIKLDRRILQSIKRR